MLVFLHQLLMFIIDVHILLMFPLHFLMISEAVRLHLPYSILMALVLYSFNLVDLLLNHSTALNSDAIYCRVVMVLSCLLAELVFLVL